MLANKTDVGGCMADDELEKVVDQESRQEGNN